MADANSNLSLLLTSEQAAQHVFGVSLRTFQSMRDKEWFTARPRNLGPKTVRWVRSELEALVLNIPASNEKAPMPAHLKARKDAIRDGAGRATPTQP
jgi:predicted DNA-binding transcriptional regulator AlpA